MTSSTQSRAWLIPFLGFACCIGVSSIYFNQPLLLEMAKTFHVSLAHTGYVATATQVGYSLGLLFVVPLGDMVESRKLMMRLFGAVSVALFGVAFAPNVVLLILSSFLVGIFASVTHIALPIAPSLVPEERRGRAIGTVMTGLLLGILLARSYAGWISNASHWQVVYITAGCINLLFVPILWRVMPRRKPQHNDTYSMILRSLWTLFRDEPLLRATSFVGACVFASFSAFWTTLVFLLDKHYGLGPGVAGSFGVLGATGALIAPFAGRMADRRGSRYVVGFGLTMLATSYILLWFFGFHMLGLVVAIILLDAGAQTTQIANQTRIFGIDPEKRSRLNTVYMVIYFTGAAVGSFLAVKAWIRFEWAGVCAVALGFLSLAALIHLLMPRGPVPQAHIDSKDAVLEA